MKEWSSPDKNWEIPSFSFEEYAEKKTKYCFCIPVINEGERIKKELKTIHELGISNQIDVIIADGGSTDDSLEVPYLKGCGVRSLLVKKGPGKLSAQMRMAMAYALSQNYEGIIFIDGNDKDDPIGVHGFIQKLEEGYDHVQGSRFAKGGKAINTPAIRYFGLRLVHAPMISIASGFWYTDTTNGFRAYSRRFLTDPRVLPLRNIFSVYEIHYYLAIRAVRLKFKVIEIPVIREYPKSGKVPTKISPIRGIFNLLYSTLKACLGHYNPEKIAP
jgi:dolichol-phosphate mannosyltransferase